MVPPRIGFLAMDLFLTFVKGRLYYLRTYQATAYINLDFLADACEFNWQVSESNILLQVGCRTSGRDLTNTLTVDDNILFVTCDTALVYFKPGQFLFHSRLLLIGERISSDKVTFIQLADPPKVGFQQCCALRKFVPVERQAGFKPQRISGSESAR